MQMKGLLLVQLGKTSMVRGMRKPSTGKATVATVFTTHTSIPQVRRANAQRG